MLAGEEELSHNSLVGGQVLACTLDAPMMACEINFEAPAHPGSNPNPNPNPSLDPNPNPNPNPNQAPAHPGSNPNPNPNPSLDPNPNPNPNPNQAPASMAWGDAPSHAARGAMEASL